MPFLSRDKVENVMGKSVDEMDHNELVKYFKAQQKVVNKVDISVTTADHVIVKKFLIEQYGQPQAGRIIKWLFYRYAGKTSVKGEVEVASIRSFNARMKWWVDLLNVESQQMVTAESKPAEVYVSADF